MKIPKEKFLEFLKNSASIVVADGETYVYFPNWFRFDRQKKELEVLNFEKMPQELKDHIDKVRQGAQDSSKNEFYAKFSKEQYNGIFTSFFTNVKTEN